MEYRLPRIAGGASIVKLLLKKKKLPTIAEWRSESAEFCESSRAACMVTFLKSIVYEDEECRKLVNGPSTVYGSQYGEYKILRFCFYFLFLLLLLLLRRPEADMRRPGSLIQSLRLRRRRY